MTILIIDNYDSFVYNLARYVSELGYKTQVIRNDALSVQEILNQINPQKIILSPGPCTPNEAGISLALVSYFADKIPILGVCLGHQTIAQAFGGEIIRASKPMHGKVSRITHDTQTIFQNVPSPLTVARYHSLVVSENNFPESLIIRARSETREIMALQHKQFPVFGVQFHPESIITEYGKEMIQNFLNIGAPDRS